MFYGSRQSLYEPVCSSTLSGNHDSSSLPEDYNSPPSSYSRDSGFVDHDGLDNEPYYSTINVEALSPVKSPIYDQGPGWAQVIPNYEGYHHTTKSASEYGITVPPSCMDPSRIATGSSLPCNATQLRYTYISPDVTIESRSHAGGQHSPLVSQLSPYLFEAKPLECHSEDDGGYRSGHQSIVDVPYLTPVSNSSRSSYGSRSSNVSSGSSSSSNPRKSTRSMTSQYLCDICSQKFARRDNLYRHRLDSHASRVPKVGGISAELRQSIHNSVNKMVPPSTPTDPTLPLSRTVSTMFERTALDILPQQAPSALRQNLQCLSEQLSRFSGEQMRHHLIDIICGLQTLHSLGSTRAYKTIVECEILYESEFVTIQAFSMYKGLASMLENMRIMEIIPVPVSLRVKPVPQFNDQHPTPAINKAGSEGDKYQSDVGPYSTTFLRIKGQRYLVAKLPRSGTESTLPDYAVTLSRIKDVLLQATDIKESAFDEEPDQGRKTIHAIKRKRDDGAWFYYDDISSNAEEEEEEDEDSEDEDGAGRPSFLPYFFNTEANAISPADSMESGSSSSGSGNQDTPASSISDQSGGSGPHNNVQPPAQGPGTGSPDNQNGPLVGNKNGNSPQVPGRQPLPFICWYPAAGTPCSAKHAKRAADTRYLLNDHVWGKNPRSPNHRLPSECPVCHLLFENKVLAEAHFKSIREKAPGVCVEHSLEELQELNRRPNSLGITEQRKVAIDSIRAKIRNGKVPHIYDDDTMALLNQRVESNILLYINGSDITEKAARTELWKWYIIFKQLRPDDEVPLNPFTSKCPVTGTDNRPQASILRIFNSTIDQLCSDKSLPQFSDAQRNVLNQALLNTVEILGAEEDQERSRSAQNTPKNARKRQKMSPPDVERPTVPGLTPAENTLQAQPEAQDQVQAQGIGNQEIAPPQPRPSPQLRAPVPLPQINTLQAAQASVPPLPPMGTLGVTSHFGPHALPNFYMEPQINPGYNPQQQEQQQQQDYNAFFPLDSWPTEEQYWG